MAKQLLLLFSPYLFYLSIATVVYIFQKEKYLPSSFFGFLFPRKCYWTKSAGIDLFVSILNSFFVGPLFLFAVGLFLLSTNLNNIFQKTAGEISFSAIDLSWTNMAVAIVVFCIVDGVNTLQHYLSHRVGFLWELHKVHHSAEALNLWTAERHHPVSSLIANFLNQASSIFVILVFRFFMGENLNIPMIWAVANLIGLVLKPVDVMKHTHVWISFGKLGYILQSPAMHQMHHSVEAKYHHKNFATFFSLWDWMLGTLYIPESKLELICGLKKSVWGSKRFDSFWGVLVDPLKKN